MESRDSPDSFRFTVTTGDGGEMVTQEDTIFVQGMNPETTEEEIAEHFGSIGLIKVCC